MYEELVKELRMAAQDSGRDSRYLYFTLINRAADAIEELCQTVEEQKAQVITALPDEAEKAEFLENMRKSTYMVATAAQEPSIKRIKEWISTDDALPNDGQIVLVHWWNVHCASANNVSVMQFRKGRTKEELKDAKYIGPADEYGNNLKPYKWDDPHGPLSIFGQEVSHWMPLPEPPKEADNGTR